MQYRDPLRYGKHLDDLASFGDVEMFAVKVARYINAVENEVPAYRPKKKRGRKKAAFAFDDALDGVSQNEGAPPMDVV